MLASPTRKGDGIARCQDGVFTSDGTAVTLNLGFIPTYFLLVNQTDVIIWEKMRGMAAANCIKVVTAGTTTLDTGSGVVINADGTVTISATAAGTAKSHVWMAQG
jgi:hypothetical protein